MLVKIIAEMQKQQMPSIRKEFLASQPLLSYTPRDRSIETMKNEDKNHTGTQQITKRVRILYFSIVFFSACAFAV